MPPRLSLVIPAYHEAQRLPATVAALIEFCTGLDCAHEVLIVVERSADGTLEMARRLVQGHGAFAVIDNMIHRGKGYAVRRGMERAKGDFIFYMDADLSVPLVEVHRFLAHFHAHPEVDVLVGNRQHAQSRILQRQSFVRRTLGQTFNLFLRLAGLASLHDTQCGFKAFRCVAARAIFARQRIDGFAFDVEVILLAEELGCTITDLPVEWINSPASHVRIVSDSIKMLRDMILVRRRFAHRLRD
jgi:dolichyl-phosphate beta-glucosyltransferase